MARAARPGTGQTGRVRLASTANAAGRPRVAAADREVARVVLDCAFLVLVLAISLLPYVRGLGFYYDDYSVLERMHAAADQSLGGLYDAVRPITGQRPLQAFIFAALYRIFGLDATGYHAVNACLLAAVAILLYLVLRELGLPRLLCVALPLVYSTLPHYATNRFWLDAFEINLSSVFFLASSYFALRALRALPVALVAWLALASVCVAASLFAYEVAFPLYLLVIALLWWAGPHPETTRGARWMAIGSIVAAALAAGIVKTTLVVEHGQNAYQIGVQSGLAHHLAYLVSGSIKVNLGTYLLAAPYVVWWIVRHRFSSAEVGAALAAGAVALVYLRGIVARDARALAPAGERPWRNVTKVGVVAWLLGYAIFLTNERVLFRSAGIDNRVNAAAALGVAAVAVGGVGWLATRLPEPRRAAVFSVAIACVVACGVLVVACLGGFWTEAARRAARDREQPPAGGARVPARQYGDPRRRLPRDGAGRRVRRPVGLPRRNQRRIRRQLAGGGHRDGRAPRRRSSALVDDALPRHGVRQDVRLRAAPLRLRLPAPSAPAAWQPARGGAVCVVAPSTPLPAPTRLRVGISTPSAARRCRERGARVLDRRAGVQRAGGAARAVHATHVAARAARRAGRGDPGRRRQPRRQLRDDGRDERPRPALQAATPLAELRPPDRDHGRARLRCRTRRRRDGRRPAGPAGDGARDGGAPARGLRRRLRRPPPERPAKAGSSASARLPSTACSGGSPTSSCPPTSATFGCSTGKRSTRTSRCARRTATCAG